MGPTTADAAVNAQLNSAGYPALRIALISIFPRPAASAIAEPVIPEKIIDAITFTWAKPPACPSDDALGEVEHLFGDGPRIHHVGGKDEQRYRHEDEAIIKPTHHVLCRETHRESFESEIDGCRGKKGQGHRHSHDERNGENRQKYTELAFPLFPPDKFFCEFNDIYCRVDEYQYDKYDRRNKADSLGNMKYWRSLVIDELEIFIGWNYRDRTGEPNDQIRDDGRHRLGAPSHSVVNNGRTRHARCVGACNTPTKSPPRQMTRRGFRMSTESDLLAHNGKIFVS